MPCSGAQIYFLDVRVQSAMTSLQYSLGEKHEVMGSALYIPLPAGLQPGSSVKVTIEYNTTELGCKALQWLDKASVAIELVLYSR